MASLIALLWFFGSIAALWFIIKPKRSWVVVANRKRALAVFAATFLGLPLLLSLTSATHGAGNSAPVTQSALTPAQKAQADQEARLSDARNNPEKYLKITSISPYKEGFDTILAVSGKIENVGPISVKDPTIQCDILAESGTKLGTARETAYKIIKAGDSVTITDLNMGFVNSSWDSVSCSVVGATVVQTSG